MIIFVCNRELSGCLRRRARRAAPAGAASATPRLPRRARCATPAAPRPQRRARSASGSFGISYEISYVKFHLKFRRAFLFAVFLIGILAVPRLCVVSALRARRARRAAPTAQGTPRGFTSGSRPEAIRKHFLTFFGCLLDVCCRFLGFLLLLQLSRLL